MARGRWRRPLIVLTISLLVVVSFRRHLERERLAVPVDLHAAGHIDSSDSDSDSGSGSGYGSGSGSGHRHVSESLWSTFSVVKSRALWQTEKSRFLTARDERACADPDDNWSTALRLWSSPTPLIAPWAPGKPHWRRLALEDSFTSLTSARPSGALESSHSHILLAISPEITTLTSGSTPPAVLACLDEDHNGALSQSEVTPVLASVWEALQKLASELPRNLKVGPKPSLSDFDDDASGDLSMQEADVLIRWSVSFTATLRGFADLREFEQRAKKNGGKVQKNLGARNPKSAGGAATCGPCRKGEASCAQKGQDTWALEVSTRTDPFFVDLAASSPICGSNTFLLEKAHSWRGLCIEANPHLAQLLRTHRSCATLEVAVDDRVRNVSFIAQRQSLGGIIDPAFDNTEDCKLSVADCAEVGVIHVTTRRLDTLLREARAPATIDYLSLDVEGAEASALPEDFPFADFVFLSLTVERPPPELNARLLRHGYRFVRNEQFDTFFVHASHPQAAVLAGGSLLQVPAKCTARRNTAVPGCGAELSCCEWPGHPAATTQYWAPSDGQMASA